MHYQAGGREKVPQKTAEPVETRKEIAKAAGVSHDTVRKVGAVLASADEAVKADMIAGKTKINASLAATWKSSQHHRSSLPDYR